jgi:FMN phosphatase YigB (HAD superfamily)
MERMIQVASTTLNAELSTYFSSLRPCYQTALLGNSFVSARSREQERYHYLIIYSHVVGIAKPERRIFELTCERLGCFHEAILA